METRFNVTNKRYNLSEKLYSVSFSVDILIPTSNCLDNMLYCNLENLPVIRGDIHVH